MTTVSKPPSVLSRICTNARRFFPQTLARLLRRGQPTPHHHPEDHSGDSVGVIVRELLAVALPLMVSAGTFSLVLFIDRTLLLWYDGASMSASMAGGNFFWVSICLPVGIASMTGAIISQYVGSGEEHRIGRFLWQSIWLALLSAPFFALVAYFAPDLFRLSEQPDSLVPAEATYLRLLLIGAVGAVLENALSGFFSGTERTRVIMWVSLMSGLVNLVFDWILIFGAGPFPELGIAGAAIASSIAFWFKAVCFAFLILYYDSAGEYQVRRSFGFDWPLIKKLLFFGFPSGLMFLTEASGFTAIVLQIGKLGDVPLRATTMAINFNMVAFIPLVGVSIAASVLVGRHLLETGPARAIKSVFAALAIGWIYSALWCVGYLALPDTMMNLYELNTPSEDSALAIEIARGLLKFVAIYVVVDATQLILAGALRGAGDTWFVLGTGLATSVFAFGFGVMFEPAENQLNWWWWMITLWVWMLALFMAARFTQGKWKTMRMV
ncbi:MATE family efflux transporter [Novipirellula artificiosorum]|uniref:Multidrug-efflux transporter n=1 Tax=Novipirellula artificiosorum TaxID=2528016 RepID=A0A5C6E4J8_9BACT|nr:MATE family efflux transporter [Novipirellula artificiosorum]TWU42511.1 Multidrug resistance protein MdtK [Novipirellula artificiosorum]